MSANVVAIKYARAFAKLTGTESQRAEEYLRMLSGVKQLFEISEACKVLCSPAMPPDLKKSLLNYSIQDLSPDDLCKNFVNSVVDAGRTEIFPEIITCYQQIVDVACGRVCAHLTSAVDLNEGELSSIKKQLESIFNKQVQIKSHVNPDLLGGFVARVRNNMVDLSLKTRLEALTNHSAL
ncbi:MAG: ATP synthase F1 subunit delta [Oligoflexales bacterium]